MKKLFYTFTLSILLFLTLQVSETQAAEDKTAPVVEEIKILTPVVAPGGKVKIQITVSDDVSGMKNAGLLFKSPSGNVNFIPVLQVREYDPLSNTYTFESEELSNYAELGDWQLAMITTKDYANNERNYYSHVPEHTIVHNVFFTVSSDAPTEETPGTDDGFTSIETKTDVPLNKEFTITFNMNIDISTILQNNIYIKDSNGNNVPLMFIIDRGADLQTSQVIVAPVGSYRSGSAYTLYIKDIVSTTGSKMAYGTKMKFTTK